MPRPILETLREIRRGAFLDEAAAQLTELVNAVTASGKGGSLNLRISVQPAGKGSSVRTVMVQDQITLNLPTPDREVTIFFPTNEGDLSRTDPSQLSLGLRGVEAPAKPIQPIQPPAQDAQSA